MGTKTQLGPPKSLFVRDLEHEKTGKRKIFRLGMETDRARFLFRDSTSNIFRLVQKIVRL